MKHTFPGLVLLLVMFNGFAQSSNIDFETYNPPSSLVVPQHIITKSKYPFIDIHNHQNNMSPQKLAELVKIMDTLNMAVMVNLSGSSGDNLKNSINNIKTAAPKRFAVFANINFTGIGEAGWSDT